MNKLRDSHRGRPLLRFVLGMGLVFAAGTSPAQTSTVPSEGVATRPQRQLLLINARIVPEPGRVIENGSVEMRDGHIVAVHSGVPTVVGAATRDMRGKTVFAGFVEPLANVGVPEDMRSGAIKPAAQPAQGPHQTTLDQAGPRHWNRRVRPEWSVADRLDYKPEEAKILRNLGFAAAFAAPGAGVMKGQGAVLSLRDGSQDKDLVLARDRAHLFGFELAGGLSGE
jgi:hypothetical protein